MARHYDSATKQEARNFIIDFVKSHDVEVSRVFTLPSEKGYCAQNFRTAFPKCRVIGIERDLTIVLHSDLVIGDGPDTFKVQCLDALYLCNTSDLLNGGVIQQRVYRKVDAIDQGRAPVSRRVNVDIGKFDLIFLDYTAMPTAALRDEVLAFENRYATDHAVMAVTFTITKSGPVFVMTLFPHAKIYLYDNAKSKMCILIWERENV